MKFFYVIALIIYANLQTILAYPQYIAKGYTTCGSCHYSPTGGGLLNSYGHATINPSFLAKESQRVTKNNVTGFNAQNEPEWQWDVGFDSRLLVVKTTTEVNGGNTVRAIPMLLEAGGVVAHGPLLLYSTVSARRAGAGKTVDSAFSREHWLQYRFNDTWSLRGGRIVLPFGLRIPDHTQYTREDHGFTQWGQNYALETNYQTENWSISVAGFSGDFLLDPVALQSRGGVVSVSRHFPGIATIGSSLRAAITEHTWNTDASVFSKLRFLSKAYGMVEISPLIKMHRDADLAQNTLTTYARLGYFLLESLDLYADFGTRHIFENSDLTKLRYGVGTDWQIIPWIEFSPTILIEHQKDTGPELTAYAQIHVVF